MVDRHQQCTVATYSSGQAIEAFEHGSTPHKTILEG